MIPADEPVSTVTNSVLNGQNVKCYAWEKEPLLSEYGGYKACFEMDTGMLAAWEWSFNTELHRFEYSRFLHNGKKLFPGTMRRFRNGDLLTEVNVDSISNASMDTKVLDPPSNAIKQAPCTRFQPAEADYTNEYFKSVPTTRPVRSLLRVRWTSAAKFGELKFSSPLAREWMKRP
jgi:hypothetical protein